MSCGIGRSDKAGVFPAPLYWLTRVLAYRVSDLRFRLCAGFSLIDSTNEPISVVGKILPQSRSDNGSVRETLVLFMRCCSSCRAAEAHIKCRFDSAAVRAEVVDVNAGLSAGMSDLGWTDKWRIMMNSFWDLALGSTPVSNPGAAASRSVHVELTSQQVILTLTWREQAIEKHQDLRSRVCYFTFTKQRFSLHISFSLSHMSASDHIIIAGP